MEIDPRVGLLMLALVVAVFLLALLVPRRPRPAHIPVTEAKLDEIKRRMEEIEIRQAKNDHDVKNIRMAMGAMPTERSVGELREQIAHLDGRFEGMHDTLMTNGRSLDRIVDFLMNNFSPANGHTSGGPTKTE